MKLWRYVWIIRYSKSHRMSHKILIMLENQLISTLWYQQCFSLNWKLKEQIGCKNCNKSSDGRAIPFLNPTFETISFKMAELQLMI